MTSARACRAASFGGRLSRHNTRARTRQIRPFLLGQDPLGERGSGKALSLVGSAAPWWGSRSHSPAVLRLHRSVLGDGSHAAFPWGTRMGVCVDCPPFRTGFAQQWNR